MSTFWGKRVGLRPFEEPLTDIEAARVYQWSRDPELLRWSGGEPTDLSLEEFRRRLNEESRNGSEHRRAFYIVNRAGELIGRVGIFAIEWDQGEGELGIVIGDRANRGHGYGRDAVTILLSQAFEMTPLKRIRLFTYPDNLQAQRCFAASGFRTLGIARRFSPDLGEYDSVEMEITRRDFLEQRTDEPTPIQADMDQV